MSQRDVLNVIQIEKPCPANWDRMSGDARTRFCGQCQREVHNLSAMPADEAERLVCRSAGALCVRFDRDAEGRMITLDYEKPPERRHGWRYWTIVAGCVAILGCVADAIGLNHRLTPRTPVAGGPVMGACPPIRLGNPPAGSAAGALAGANCPNPTLGTSSAEITDHQ